LEQVLWRVHQREDRRDLEDLGRLCRGHLCLAGLYLEVRGRVDQGDLWHQERVDPFLAQQVRLFQVVREVLFRERVEGLYQELGVGHDLEQEADLYQVRVERPVREARAVLFRAGVEVPCQELEVVLDLEQGEGHDQGQPECFLQEEQEVRDPVELGHYLGQELVGDLYQGELGYYLHLWQEECRVRVAEVDLDQEELECLHRLGQEEYRVREAEVGHDLEGQGHYLHLEQMVLLCLVQGGRLYLAREGGLCQELVEDLFQGQEAGHDLAQQALLMELMYLQMLVRL